MVTDTQSALLGTSNYVATVEHVSHAKYWIRQTLAGRVDADTLFDISLCVVELVDNARKHGPAGGVISVAVYKHHETVRLQVTDDGSNETAPHVTENYLTVDGHGLRIVSNVTKRWGSYRRHDHRQTVWCEFVTGLVRLPLRWTARGGKIQQFNREWPAEIQMGNVP
jgi:two-component sensor histidine kinase